MMVEGLLFDAPAHVTQPYCITTTGIPVMGPLADAVT